MSDELIEQLRRQILEAEEEIASLKAQVGKLMALTQHYELRLRRLETGRTARPQPAGVVAAAAGRLPAVSRVAQTQPGPSTLSHGVELPTPPSSPNSTAAPTIDSPHEVEAARAALTICQYEDAAPFKEVVRQTVAKYGCQWTPHDEGGASTANPLVAVNLLVRSADPFTAIAQAAGQAKNASVFAYCAEGEWGLVFSMVDFFPPPLDAGVCATRLLSRADKPQRILIISDAVDATRELRDTLTRAGRTTSLAFDARQAASLVPISRPDLVLIDLSLPKGEGLRAVNRLRSDPATARLKLAFLWGANIDLEEFRDYALRTIRYFPLSAEDLGRAIGRVLAPGGVGFSND
jgi:CheY-like chemotaxis protein